MKILKDSSITPASAIENFHYPGYVIILQKERQLQANGKIWTKNLHDVPANQTWICSIKTLKLSVASFQMNRRPLRMVMVRKENMNLKIV